MSWSTSELRMRFLLLNRFKPSSKIHVFYWPFQGRASFVDLFFSVLCLLCLCARLSICVLWSPAGKGLTSWLSFVVWICHFPIGILGQVWYLIVSIPDLCTLTYIYVFFNKMPFVLLQPHLLLCWHGFCAVSITLCYVIVRLSLALLK